MMVVLNQSFVNRWPICEALADSARGLPICSFPPSRTIDGKLFSRTRHIVPVKMPDLGIPMTFCELEPMLAHHDFQWVRHRD